eukprot:TRINITY_DN19561_c0_g1_i1.p1 TRINITY_DN19561_c0_g1~~TRINITY_DN19561_c0_g1_i1.p1  ORF type:complete len:307 (+),score=68.51 TRINITY_DN19561_c0_g1_i1:56-976(+)
MDSVGNVVPPFQQNVWVCLQTPLDQQRVIPQQVGQQFIPLTSPNQMQQLQMVQMQQPEVTGGLHPQMQTTHLQAPLQQVVRVPGTESLISSVPSTAGPSPSSSMTNITASINAGISAVQEAQTVSAVPPPPAVQSPATRRKGDQKGVRIAMPAVTTGLPPPLDEESSIEEGDFPAPAPAPKKKNKKSRRRKLDAQRFKTVMCRNFLKSGCAFGAECAFAHDESEIVREEDVDESFMTSPKKQLKKKNRKQSAQVEDTGIGGMRRMPTEWGRRASAVAFPDNAAAVIAFRRASAPAALVHGVLQDIE